MKGIEGKYIKIGKDRFKCLKDSGTISEKEYAHFVEMVELRGNVHKNRGDIVAWCTKLKEKKTASQSRASYVVKVDAEDNAMYSKFHEQIKAKQYPANAAFVAVKIGFWVQPDDDEEEPEFRTLTEKQIDVLEEVGTLRVPNWGAAPPPNPLLFPGFFTREY